MNQIEAETLTPAPASRRRKWLWLGGSALVLAAGLFGLYGYVYFAAEHRLRKAMAEADRLDPGWRFEDIQAARVPIRDEDNSALVVIAAKAALPKPCYDEEVDNEIRELSPPVLLTVGQRGRLDAVWGKAEKSLVEARKLITMARGRHPVQWKPDLISSLLPTVQDTREIAWLLSVDALRRAQSGDGAGALESCQAMLNAGRSLGDEPCTICQLVREACRNLAIREIERSLALSEPPGESLARLQQALEADLQDPTLLWALRGERALHEGFLQFLQGSGDKTKYFRELLGMRNVRPTPAELVQLRMPGSFKYSRAASIEYNTQLVEAARLPEPEQARRLGEVEATLDQQPLLLRMLGPTFFGSIVTAHHRSVALLRATSAGLAAERYRREHGRWPETLATLVPQYLSQVPVDPRDGQPLRLRRFDDGIVIYSVGADGDDGGVINWNAPTTPPKNAEERKPLDWGIRLWDVSRRRQTPVAKPAVPPGEKPDAKSE